MIETAKPFLDLSRRHFVHERGDLVIFGVWVPKRLPGEETATEPALAIIPRYAPITRPIVIALSAAFKYDDAHYAARAAMTFCPVLGMEATPTNALKIANLINDFLSDLVSMPPQPTEAIVVADAELRGSDGRNRSLELLEHVAARL